MRRLIAVTLFVVGASLVGASFGARAQGQNLSETLKQPAHKAAWDKLLKGQKVPAWLSNFSKTAEGVVIPSVLVEIDGVRYQMDHVCKPHDCSGNEFEVLFAPEGQQAWGALVTKGGKPRFFGAPSPKQRQALQDQLKQ